jgi:hypothetical protein
MGKVNAQRMNEVANVIKQRIPGKGFALVVFDFGDGLRDFSYISNAQRTDMIATFEALILKWKNETPKKN